MVCDTFSLLDAQQLFPLHPAKGYTLDLLFASPDCVVDLECLDPLLHSDNHHVPQYFRVSAPLHSQDDSSVPLRHNFFKCNYLAVNEHFNNIDWDNCLDSGDVSACVSKFNDVVSQAISSHVPLSSSSQCSFPKWYTHELKSLINDKKCAHLMWKSSHNYSALSEFKVLRAKCLRLSRSLYKDYVEDTEQSLKRNIKYY